MYSDGLHALSVYHRVGPETVPCSLTWNLASLGRWPRFYLHAVA